MNVARATYNCRMSNFGKLTIVPTPIGNLSDITLRALDALREADAVLCEDTRVTGKLLSHFEIKKPLVRLDENTIRQKAPSIIERLQTGQALAYCSDAGMPGVSDPGMILVAQAHEAGIPVEVLPGASAATTAYVASGVTNTRFLFAGFMPRKNAEREQYLQELAGVDAALVFYESPHRLADSLAVVARIMPARCIAVCRELTKMHEEIVRGSAVEVAELFAERVQSCPLKGEIALVIDGPSDGEGAAAQVCALVSAEAQAAELLAGGKRSKEVAQVVAESCGLARNQAYDLVLSIQSENA